MTSWLTEESDRAALSAVFHVRWCWSTEHSPATVILPVRMGYDGCFIICTHYLKHSGRNTGTLRWITLTNRSILQRPLMVHSNILPASTTQIYCILLAFSFKVGSKITAIISLSGEKCPLLVMIYSVEEFSDKCLCGVSEFWHFKSTRSASLWLNFTSILSQIIISFGMLWNSSVVAKKKYQFIFLPIQHIC